MITTLFMLVCAQLPMQGISDNVKMAAITQPPPAVIVKEVPVVKTITKEVVVKQRVYVYIDKFGIEHEGENRDAVRKEFGEANAKPWQLKDATGKLWEHPDRSYLEKWIADRNRQINSSFETKPAPAFEPQTFVPSTQYLPAALMFNSSPVLPAMNCGPVG